MKITRLSIYEVGLTSHIRYAMSDGKVCDTVPSVILRLETDGGITGWGESAPSRIISKHMQVGWPRRLKIWRRSCWGLMRWPVMH